MVGLGGEGSPGGEDEVLLEQEEVESVLVDRDPLPLVPMQVIKLDENLQKNEEKIGLKLQFSWAIWGP